MRQIRVSFFGIALAMSLVLIGCGTIDSPRKVAGGKGEQDKAETQAEPQESAREVASSFSAWNQGPQREEFLREFNQESIDRDLVQFFRLLQSHDYFGQFTRGDSIFEDYLVTYFGIEDGPLYPGGGVERTVYDQQGGVRSRIRQVLLNSGEKELEGRWWQIWHSQNGAEVLYETLVGPYGVPREIRYRELKSDAYRSRTTNMGKSVIQAEEQMDPEEIRSRLKEEREREIRNYMPPQFANLEQVGQETITVAGRELFAARLEAPAPGQGEGKLVAFYSPDVPGGLLRISFQGKPYMEITDWIEEGSREITDDMVSAQGPAMGAMPQTGSQPQTDEPSARSYEDEGNTANPVQLAPGAAHRGTVSAQGKSYYVVTSDERSDLTIELLGLRGSASLYSYGDDAAFENWYTGSEGGNPSFTEYFVPQGEQRFFTVESMDGAGTQYTVRVTADPMLDPLGVRSRGAYRKSTEPLRRGTNELLVLPGALNYFEIPAQDSNSISLEVTGLQEGKVDFSFLEVAGGSYSGASGMQRSSSEKEIRLQGLSSGSRLIFYLVASRDASEQELTVTVK